MTTPTATEQFINWLTGKPMALFDAVGSIFNAAPNNTIGLVPDPGAVPGTTKFLREDATWDVPAGTYTPTNFTPAGVGHAAGIVPDPGASAHTPPYFLMDDATFRNFVSLGYNLINGTIVESHSSNAATFAIKTLAGADPSSTDTVYIVFRNSTAGTGDYVILPITSAFSITVSSGSTLGASSTVAFKIWLVCFNDGGTVRLGIINCSNAGDIFFLAGWQIASSTAEGGAGAADSAGIFYTDAAVSSKPYTILGYMTWEAGLATAGTWVTSPTRIQIKNDAVPNPGSVIQNVQFVTGASATGTTVMPGDDTIPLITEGDQYLSKSITPTSAAHVLIVESQLVITASNAVCIAAVFASATNAVAAMWANNVVDSPRGAHIKIITSATAVAITYSTRGGPASASTATVNGVSGARRLGGVMNSYIYIMELAT